MANFWENRAWGESPKIVANFWENWAPGESPKIVAIFWENLVREIPSARDKSRRHVQTQLKDLPSDSEPGGSEPPTDPDRPYCICLVGH